MFFKFNTLTLASLSMLLAACGGGSDPSGTNNTTSSNTNKIFDTAWFDVDEANFSVNSTSSDTSTTTEYIYDIRALSFDYNSTNSLLSYNIQSLVGPTSLSFKKAYTATATQLLTRPATISSNGIPIGFLTNETTNSITVAPYNQEGIKNAALTRTTFKQTDISGTLISDAIAAEISSPTLASNPHFLKVKNAGLKFPTGSIILEETQYEVLEDYIEFDTLSSFATISDYKAGTTLGVGQSFTDNNWANGAVKSSCVISSANYRYNCVAEYAGKLYVADYSSKEIITDTDELDKFLFFNKTAADALNNAYKDNFKSETITTTTSVAAEAAAK